MPENPCLLPTVYRMWNRGTAKMVKDVRLEFVYSYEFWLHRTLNSRSLLFIGQVFHAQKTFSEVVQAVIAEIQKLDFYQVHIDVFWRAHSIFAVWSFKRLKQLNDCLSYKEKWKKRPNLIQLCVQRTYTCWTLGVIFADEGSQAFQWTIEHLAIDFDCIS